MSTYQPAPQEPSDRLTDPHELLSSYLDFYRSTVLRKLDGLSEETARTSAVPTGWTPVGLLKHLTYVERRWLQWGFAAEPVDEPWGDHDPADGGWRVGAGESLAGLREAFLEQCERSRRIVASATLDERSRVGGRFRSESDAPALAWILFHLVQEYARHVGHLDIARELADGAVGE